LKKSWRHIAISLSGAMQAAMQVEHLAKTGLIKPEQFETAVRSLLDQNPESVESVFQGISHLESGAETLSSLLSDHRDPKHADLLRYTLGIIHLQKKLAKRSDVLYIVGTRLDKVQHQVEHFGYTHDNVVGNIADIYTDTISKFQYRIQVTGEYSYLQQQRVANQIRVLLLSGIRSATLWRQSGGTRWQFLFYRDSLAKAVDELLDDIKRSRNFH